MATVIPFNLRTRTEPTAAELAGTAPVFDGAKYHRAFQRTSSQALQEFQAAQPQLAGAPTELFKRLASVYDGLRQAVFYRESTEVENAPLQLAEAVKALVEFKATADTINSTSSKYDMSQFLQAERTKCGGLLVILDMEVGRVEAMDRAASQAAVAIADGAPIEEITRLIDDMHRVAVEALLVKFAER